MFNGVFSDAKRSTEVQYSVHANLMGMSGGGAFGKTPHGANLLFLFASRMAAPSLSTMQHGIVGCSQPIR